MNHKIMTYGDPKSPLLLIQMVDEHDMELMDNEIAYIKELTGRDDFCLKAVKVDNWNDDLSPWQAPAVFGKEDFGGGASDTLSWLLGHVIPEELVQAKLEGYSQIGGKFEGSVAGDGSARQRVVIGGYSLAGLFAIWAGYHSDCFDGIAAASPSVWFPDFTRYMRENQIYTDVAYLSLGDREDRSKNPIMREVGFAIREAYMLLKASGVECTLEWNEGNHFKDSDLRTARAFAWVIKGLTEVHILDE